MKVNSKIKDFNILFGYKRVKYEKRINKIALKRIRFKDFVASVLNYLNNNSHKLSSTIINKTWNLMIYFTNKSQETFPGLSTNKNSIILLTLIAKLEMANFCFFFKDLICKLLCLRQTFWSMCPQKVNAKIQSFKDLFGFQGVRCYKIILG